MAAKYLYSPRYDFQLLGLQKLHKFDGGKFSEARDHFIAQRPSTEIIEPHSIATGYICTDSSNDIGRIFEGKLENDF